MSVKKDRMGDTSLPSNVQMYLVDISGQLVPALADTSGHIAVEVDVGDVIAVVSGPVAAQGTNLSGVNLTLRLLSGTRELVTRVSGQTVNIASGAYTHSGQGVLVASGVGSLVSGQMIQLQSGYVISLASGQYVIISGQGVLVASGVGVLVSGQMVQLESGYTIKLASGQFVSVSGQGVLTQSGVGTLISGQTVAIESGTIIKVSGEVLKVQAPSALLANYVQVNSQSGGLELASGAVVHVNVKNVATSGHMWIGPPGILSGAGYRLKPDEEKGADIDNLNKVYVFSEMSGDYVSYLGEVA